MDGFCVLPGLCPAVPILNLICSTYAYLYTRSNGFGLDRILDMPCQPGTAEVQSFKKVSFTRVPDCCRPPQATMCWRTLLTLGRTTQSSKWIC